MKNRLNYLIITIPFVIGLVLGSFFDLQINQALYMDPNTNVFGLIFSAVMPMISYAFIAFGSGYVLNFAIKDKRLIVKIFFFFVAIGGTFTSVYYTGNKYNTPNAFGESFPLIVGLLIGIVVQAGFICAGYLVSKKWGKIEYANAITIAFIIIVIQLVPLTQILKNVMRRPRFRCLVEGSDFYFEEARFMNWWQSFANEYKTLKATFGESISEHFKSFPSGHTSEAMILPIGLSFLANIIPGYEKKETLFTSLGVVFALLMALSRMTMGAHYLTDVSMGGLTMAILFIAGNEINLKFVFNKKKA